ncbi:hypothetical protein ACOZFM_11120 [Streptomyces arboris]|uniref:hypothetical protein n=1 Tax=Streptomyces arboris TaxID=2600619 RepID=UPI003BF56E14
MAAVTLETTELEILVEACLTGKKELGIDFLNLLKTKNSHEVLPNTSALVRPMDVTWQAALAGVTADLAV